MYAQVAIPGPHAAPFTYLVPAPLRARIKAGMRAEVPFGARKLTGVVVELSARSPVIRGVRELTRLLDDEPAFAPDMMNFLQWAAQYYLWPLGDVLETALPPGMARESRIHVELTDAGRAARLLGGRRDSEQAVLSAIPENKSASVAGLRRKIKDVDVDGVVLRLHQRGLVNRFAAAPEGGAGELHVMHAEWSPADERAAALLAKKPAQFRLWKQLVEQHVPPVPVSAITGGAAAARTALKGLEKCGLVRFAELRQFRAPEYAAAIPAEQGRVLTPHQQQALDAVTQALAAGKYQGFLLQGVTGSGKTEVYLRAAEAALARGNGVLFLVPEIALTPRLTALLRGRFGDQVAVLHSSLAEGERYDEWERARTARAQVVAGARSAIFAPVRGLGLIIVDEEHESSYKQEDHFRYHARDLALVRGSQSGAVVVLGSATPSIETRRNCDLGKLTRLCMPGRTGGGRLPEVEVVDMRAEPDDNDSPIGRRLRDALEENLRQGGQSILFINRRGYAPQVMCRERTCGYRHQCPRCSVGLVWHRETGLMKCHYCGYETGLPMRCPACGSARIGLLGHGTQRVDELLKDLFPSARVGRLDRDSTRRKGSLGELLQRFERRELDILTGTQMVAKGHDFPHVTLVGVLAADIGLSSPDFRNAERLFQLLTQVSGRAGRGEKPGRVVVQTLNPDFYAVETGRRADYESFYKIELESREEPHYPPWTRLALLEATAVLEERALDAARLAHQRAGAFASGKLEVLPPTPASMLRLKGRYRYHVLIKGESSRAVRDAARAGLSASGEKGFPSGVRLIADVDPVTLT
ncbi:MAG: primosomal protein N' [Myxococcota bacterium]|nr:primosomal protein N' [Myxococcota bacterium]